MEPRSRVRAYLCGTSLSSRRAQATRELLLTLTPHLASSLSPKDLLLAAAPDSIVAGGYTDGSKATIGSSVWKWRTERRPGRHSRTCPTTCACCRGSLGRRKHVCGGATARRSRKQPTSPAIVTAQSLSGWSTARGPSSNLRTMSSTPCHRSDWSAKWASDTCCWSCPDHLRRFSPCLMSRLRSGVRFQDPSFRLSK